MPQAPRPIRTADAGVTLLETLIVLVVIGVLAGGAALSLRGSGGLRDAEQEAALLAARLEIAAEHSLIGGRPARFDWDGTGYVFDEWDGSDWVAHPVPPLTMRHTVEGGLRLLAEDGAARGTWRLRADGLPEGPGPQVLRIAAAGGAAILRFDGLSARLEGTP